MWSTLVCCFKDEFGDRPVVQRLILAVQVLDFRGRLAADVLQVALGCAVWEAEVRGLLQTTIRELMPCALSNKLRSNISDLQSTNQRTFTKLAGG